MSEYDNRECNVSGCKRSFYAKGFCEMHYVRVRKHGSPHINKRSERRSPSGWFLSHFKKAPDGCWLWSGTVHSSGYGSMKIGRQNVLAHRFAYQHYYGFLDKNDCVLHVCDTPLCVNPDHLFLGTRTDNNLDKEIKGRGLKGSQIAASKLTEEIVYIARASMLSTKQLAEQYGVSNETMRLALNGTTWRHV